MEWETGTCWENQRKRKLKEREKKVKGAKERNTRRQERQKATKGEG